MKHILPLLFLFSAYFFSCAQSFKYRNYNFEWAPGRPSTIPVEEQFKNEDAVILEEKFIFNVGGNPSPVVQKHVRIKFLNQDGVKKFSTIILPESFDPSSDRSTLRPEYRDSIYRPKGEFECIRYFAARIFKPDGKISAALLDEKTQMEIVRRNKIDEKIYSWIFRIINIEPGDELELDYSYEGAFNFDPSSRIFFNGDLPKQNFDFTFRYPDLDYYIITYANGSNPTDSVMETDSRPKSTEYYFSKKNLPGGLSETGGRPYTQYPYITYYKHMRDFGIKQAGSSFITKPLPYPWSLMMLPLVKYQPQNLKGYLSWNDKTTLAINNLFNDEKSKVTDTSLAAIASSMHHTIAKDFLFLDDKKKLEGDDSENEHLGKYVSNKTLRELSRHRLYNELFLRFDRDYYSALFCDKRISRIDINEYKRSTSFRTGYAIPSGQRFVFLYPKSYRFGYEANELPFYYEDINTVLIPQHEPYDKSNDDVPLVNFTFVKTPFSEVKDNLRNTSALVTISLDSLRLSMNARIKLSGQFSTITRGYYMYADKDSTVNPNYYTTIANIADDTKHLQVQVTNTVDVFPFEASVSINLSNNTSIERASDGTYSISLEGWFNNVIDDDFTSINRHLNYYPDFLFQDSHKYMLKFDKKIQVINSGLLQKTISNGFTAYSVKITQVDENNILLESNYIVKAEYAPAENAKDVQDVFDAIKNLNNSSLRIKML